jgi:hypothetical protein
MKQDVRMFSAKGVNFVTTQVAVSVSRRLHFCAARSLHSVRGTVFANADETACLGRFLSVARGSVFHHLDIEGFACCFCFPTLQTYLSKEYLHFHLLQVEETKFYQLAVFNFINIIIIIRGATALTNLGRLSSRRWQSFPTAPDCTGLTYGQHIESHSCIFSFPNRTVTSLFK